MNYAQIENCCRGKHKYAISPDGKKYIFRYEDTNERFL